jgi:hypothetical protein
MLFLTQYTNSLLHHQWYVLPDKTYICGTNYPNSCEEIKDACPLDGEPTKLALMRIFYNIFIRGEKLKPSDPKLIEREAAQTLRTTNYNSITYTGRELFDRGAFDKEILDSLFKVTRSLFDTMPFAWLDGGNNTMWRMVNNTIMLYGSVLYEFIIIDGSTINSNIGIPQNVVQYGNNTTDYYTIAGCLIKISINGGGHAIAGLKCENQYYIYDSNNILAITDWHLNDFTAYFETARNKYNTNNITVMGVIAYLYVPDI